MGLPNKPFERTRPETIATPVNKPREAQSLWELPALRPSGGDRAVGRDIIYTIILYYILLYIELRESQTATITFSSMPQFTPDCTALSLTVERWLAVTLHMSLSYHAVECWLAVITTKTCRRFSLAENLPDTRFYVHFVWDLVAPSRLVWTHNALLPRRRHVCCVLNQNKAACVWRHDAFAATGTDKRNR